MTREDRTRRLGPEGLGGDLPTEAAETDAPTLATGAPGPPPRDLPERIGPYRVLSVLGEGGMGCVYLAEQLRPVKRFVAIKLIRAGLTSPSAVARFLAEQQALARLSHPAIAQMYEAGTTDDGYPYFVMEHVPGKPLTWFCDRQGMGLRERLELFIRVCHGVEHAHRKGILHRDLKPSNVLVTEVDGEPVPKIIDFGIAKAVDQPLTDETLLTRFGIGTPAYMSPEAFEVTPDAGVDVDTRTDVYALGVMLYELLVGSPPFKTRGASMAEIIRAVTHDEPDRLSKRFASLDRAERERLASLRGLDARRMKRRLRGDLGWIAARAMDKSRDRRYGSATELAADLRRHLDLEPVVAGPPSVGYRLGRFVLRNRASVAGAALAVSALVAGIVGTTYGKVQASREAARANAEAEKTRVALLEAEEVTEFLVDLFEVTDPREAGGDTLTARGLLDRGAERVETRLTSRPLRQARLMHTMGTIYNQLQVHQEAERLTEKALELRRQGAASTADLGDSLHRLAVTRRELAEWPEAEAAAREALRLRRADYGLEHPKVGETERELGVILYRTGRLDEAEPYVRSALAAAEAHGDPEARAASLEALGNLVKARGLSDDAVPYLEQALAIREQRLGPKDPRLAYSLLNLGSCLGEAGRYGEAKGLFERALEIQESIYGPGATAVAAARANLGIVYREAGDPDEAEAAFTQARDAFTASLGPEHPMTANAMAELGVLWWQTGRLAEAEEQLERALGIWRRTLGSDHLLTAWAEWRLANVLRDRGRPAEAELHYLRSLDARESQLPADHDDVQQTLRDYARALRELGRTDDLATVEARILGEP